MSFYQWDDNIVFHEKVTYKLSEMTKAELFALGESLREAITQIDGQLDEGRVIRGPEDEDWRRRALTAREIKARQAERIDDLLIGKAPPRERSLSMDDALAQVVGPGGRLEERHATRLTRMVDGNQKPALATHFVMAARMVLHPSMFAAIEEQAARLAEAGS